MLQGFLSTLLLSTTLSELKAYLPRRDGSTSQGTPASAQFVHGCTSITSQRTRRELQTVQACFARAFFADDAASLADGDGDVICELIEGD